MEIYIHLICPVLYTTTHRQNDHCFGGWVALLSDDDIDDWNVFFLTERCLINVQRRAAFRNDFEQSPRLLLYLLKPMSNSCVMSWNETRRVSIYLLLLFL